MTRIIKSKFHIYLFGLLALLNATSLQAATPRWLQIEIGVIGASSEDKLDSGLALAVKEHYQGVLIVLDSPGGSLESTRHMVKSLLAAELPIVVWVGPSGAHAGSAGAFITMAANIAAMAPATNIGAAHPVDYDGSNIDEEGSDLATKIENDTVAFIESIATVRKRNVAIAASLVANSLALTADEALKNQIIDLIAVSASETLDAIDGRPIVLNAHQTLTVSSKGAQLVPYQSTWKQDLLELMSNPDLFYLLFVAGLLGIALEFLHPGSLIPGVLGGISLIMALIAGSILPINFGASLLILASIAFMVAEIFIPSFGILGIGGLAGFVIGSMLLIDSKNSWGLSISLYTILPTCFLLAAVMLGVAVLLLRSHRARPKTGIEAMYGEVARAVEDWSGKEGMVQIEGELWAAQVDQDTSIKRGDKLGVVGRNGLKLSVQLLTT